MTVGNTHNSGDGMDNQAMVSDLQAFPNPSVYTALKIYSTTESCVAFYLNFHGFLLAPGDWAANLVIPV